MSSTYVLIEQSEFNNFLYDLEVLHSWARKMAGLSTSINAPAPLGMPAVQPNRGPWVDPRSMSLNQYAPSPDTTDPSDSPLFSRPGPSPRFQSFNRQYGGMDRGSGGSRYGEPENLGYRSWPPPHGMGSRDDAGLMGRCRGQPEVSVRARNPAFQAPIRNGPHRTPVITRAPNAVHTPQRGVQYVRRPRRVRPERTAGNAEVLGDETEGTESEEYVEEEHDEADLDEWKAR